MLGSIFNRDNFSRNFITCGCFCFLSIVLNTDQFFNNDYLDLCASHVKWRTISYNYCFKIVDLRGPKMAHCSRSFFSNEWRRHDITAIASFLISSGTLLFEYFSLWEKNYGIGFGHQIQQYNFIVTSNYFFVSIKLCLDVGNKEYIILCYCAGCIMSDFVINNNHHHRKTFSIITTIN